MIYRDPRKTTLNFLEFHRKHPEMYERLVERTREILKRGPASGRIGISLIAAICRFLDPQLAHDGESADGFYLDGAFLPFYSRLIMVRNPDLDGFITIRKSIADDLFADPRKWDVIEEKLRAELEAEEEELQVERWEEIQMAT